MTGFSRTGGFIYCDKSGRIFFAYPWSGETSGFYQAGTSEHEFSLSQQKNLTRSGLLGFSSAALNRNLYIQPSVTLLKFAHGVLHLVSLEGDTVKASGPVRGWFFGSDELDNIYMYFWDSKTRTASIIKYDGEGNCRSTFEYQCSRPFIKVEGFGGSRTMTLDETGNLYMLCHSEQGGMKIVKWYRQE